VEAIDKLLPVFTALLGIGVSWGMLRGEIHAVRESINALTREVGMLREWRHLASNDIAALKMLLDPSKKD
jgi:hypothetical protein